jgi:hypothetical protein
MLLSTGQVPIAGTRPPLHLCGGVRHEGLMELMRVVCLCLDRILATNALTYFDLGYISMLCDKVGLHERGAYLRSRMSQRM